MKVWPLLLLATAAGRARTSDGALLRGGQTALEGSRRVGGQTIAGVIEQLESIRKKVEEEGKGEEETFAKYSTWCRTGVKTYSREVESSKTEILIASDKVDGLKNKILALESRIAKAGKDLAANDASRSSANSTREDEAALYSIESADCGTTLGAFDSAITELEKAKKNTSGLLQVEVVEKALSAIGSSVAAMLSASQSARLSRVYLAAAGPSQATPQGDPGGDSGQHVSKYKFKSDSVIQVCKELRADFRDQCKQVEEGETNALNAYSLADASRASLNEALGDSLTQMSTENATATAKLEEEQLKLQQADTDLGDSQSDLETTRRDCTAKKAEWGERDALRKQELKSLKEATEALQTASGVSATVPVDPKLPSATTLLQLPAAANRARAVEFLRRVSEQRHSHEVSRLAQRVAANGPLDGVIPIIRRMIFRMVDEQTEDDKHKHWCDGELGKTNTSKNLREQKITAFDLKSTSVTTDAKEVQDQLNNLRLKISQSDTSTSSLSEIRAIGKTENKAAIQDAVVAQQAILQAIAALQLYFQSADPKHALVQRGSEHVTSEPSTWSGAYTRAGGVGDEQGGVIALLKKLSSEFSIMEADTRTQEETDEHQFQNDLKDAKIDKSRFNAEIKAAEGKQARLVKETASLKKSTKIAEDGLAMDERKLEQLQAPCVDGESHEDRKSKRQKEIADLRQAVDILEGKASDPAALAQVHTHGAAA